MGKAKGTASFQINDIAVTWDENTRRTEKPCVKCGAPTRGRMKNGGGIPKPAHVSCAFGLAVDKAMKVYGTKQILKDLQGGVGV